jgi:quinol monooxygenase YgiN
MATLFVRHTVSDYGAWRKVYDETQSWAKTMGVTSAGVYQLDGNPNDITVYHEFASMEAAKAFAGSDQLKEAMGKAGVVGTPDIWFTNRA